MEINRPFQVSLPAAEPAQPRVVDAARKYSVMRMFADVILARGGNIHGVNHAATAKRRAANRVAARQRAHNRRSSK